ncbi:serpin family protein [Sorangium sp. So ce124]|uniref:serpin family protein n=1 Tax=Sorangium sp. So ce124 TaxID=3133280 RepID=UPI003F5FA18C
MSGAALGGAPPLIARHCGRAQPSTGVILNSTGSGLPAAPAAIVLDRPFFFFIRDVSTQAILFAGRVNDPTAR